MWNKVWLSVLGLLLAAGMACEKKMVLKKVQLDIKGETFTVEVAQTEAEQVRGLMSRDKLGAREGMLFVNREYVSGAFWMKNTRIPLSIAFLSDTGKILDIKNMNPFDERSVQSAYAYMYALEVNKGAFREVGAARGDYIKLPEDF